MFRCMVKIAIHDNTKLISFARNARLDLDIFFIVCLNYIVTVYPHLYSHVFMLKHYFMSLLILVCVVYKIFIS